MLRKILSVSLVIMMSISLIACGQTSESKLNDIASENSVQENAKTADSESVGQEQTASDEVTETVAANEPERPETDALDWTFDESTGMLSIHGEGPMRCYSSNPPEWEQYKDKIVAVTMDEGITSVGAYAFFNYPVLAEANIPNSVEVIDISAFDYDWELKKITMPSSLKYVGQRAFYNTLIWEPSDLVFPEGCEYIGDYAFHSALKSGGKVELPSTLSYLGNQSFTNAYFSDFVIAENNENYCVKDHAVYTKDMKEIMMMAPLTEDQAEFHIADGVEKIHAECFNVINGIEKIYIPASVTEIEESSFFSTFDLKEIIVDEANPNYKSENGLLLSKDGKLLLASPDGIEGSELVVPDGVERIAENVFYGRYDSGYTIVIPEGVKEIGRMSLPYDIASITLPLSLEKIDDNVFYGGMVIGNITYNGTADDWSKITVGEGNDYLNNASIQMK